MQQGPESLRDVEWGGPAADAARADRGTLTDRGASVHGSMG